MKKLLFLIGSCALFAQAKSFLGNQAVQTPTQNGNGPFFASEQSVSSHIDTVGFDKLPTVGDSTYLFDFKGVKKMPPNVTAEFTGTVTTTQGTYHTALFNKGVLALAHNKWPVSEGTLSIHVPNPEGFQSQTYEFRLKGKYVLESEPQGEATRLTCKGQVCKLSINLAKQLPGYKDIGDISLTTVKP